MNNLQDILQIKFFIFEFLIWFLINLSKFKIFNKEDINFNKKEASYLGLVFKCKRQIIINLFIIKLFLEDWFYKCEKLYLKKEVDVPRIKKNKDMLYLKINPNANNINEIPELIKEFNVINPYWFLKMCNGLPKRKEGGKK